MKNIKEKLNNVKIEQFIELLVTMAIVCMAIVNIINVISNHQTNMFLLIGIICAMTIVTIIIDCMLYKICLNE